MSCVRFLIIALIVTCAACAQAAAPAGRYLYEVNCQAELARFDTVEKKKTHEYDLTKRPGVEGLIPISVGVLEVCLATDLVFDPVASVFHALAPTRVEPSADGKHSYRVLSFSVPGIALVGRSPAGNELDFPPRLALAAGGVRVIPPDEPWVTDVDLSGFEHHSRALPNRIVESSGTRALLSLIENGVSVFAVAERSSKTLVRLQNAPMTDLNSIHLSPGGTHVLVEEISMPGRPAPKTGRLVVYDARTGRAVKAFFEARTIDLFYHGMAPTGVALYQDSERDELVDLGITCPAQAVVLSPHAEFAALGVFFADQ